MVYLVQTRLSVAFCCNVPEVYSALLNRPASAAMLYTADNFETLRHLAEISQLRVMNNNTDETNPVGQIALPKNITETVCIGAVDRENSLSLKISNLVQNGEWAISALNGFCTATDDKALCQRLAGGSLAYPVAQWFESLNHENIVIAARQNYVKRFYRRYYYDAEQTFLPQRWLEEYQDRFFLERERRRAAFMSETFQNFQRTQLAMGW